MNEEINEYSIETGLLSTVCTTNLLFQVPVWSKPSSWLLTNNPIHMHRIEMHRIPSLIDVESSQDKQVIDIWFIMEIGNKLTQIIFYKLHINKKVITWYTIIS